MSLVMCEELPITVEEFYTLCFKEPEFTLLYHEKQGNTDAQVGQWSVAPEGRKMRVVRYVSPTASNTSMRKFGGMTTRIKEIQLAHFTPDGSFHLTCTPLFEQAVVPIDTRMQWLIEPTEGRSCRCTITANCDFQGPLFKESIEKYVEDQNRMAFRQWLDLVREKIVDLVPTEPLPRRIITSSSKYGSDAPSTPTHNTTRTQPQAFDDHSNTTPHSSHQRRADSRYNRDRKNMHYDDEESEGEMDSEEDDDNTYAVRRRNTGGVFYEANDELAAVVRLDATASPETRLATLEAYSRSTQNEMDQMEKLIVGVQSRLMRVESTVATVSTTLPIAPHPYDQPDFSLHNKRRNLLEEDREREESIQRDLALQRTLSNTDRRLAELEQTLALIQMQQLQASKKKSWFPGGWLVGAPVIMFLICWPLVSSKVVNVGLSWGSRLFLQLHHLFTNRYT